MSAYILTIFAFLNGDPTNVMVFKSQERFATINQCSNKANQLMINQYDNGISYYGTDYVMRCSPVMKEVSHAN